MILEDGKQQKDSGKTLLEMLVALALLAGILMMISLFVRQMIVKSDELKGRVQRLESMIGLEDFLRAELQKLQFVPYCAEMLPPYSEMLMGIELSQDYRRYLEDSIIISKPRLESQSTVLDLYSLRGSGGSTYLPVPRKALQGILLGSEILQVTGLLPTNLSLREGRFIGNLTADLIGVRSFAFYITDCQKSMVLNAQRRGAFFEIDYGDYEVLMNHFNVNLLQVYVVKEYLIYLQLQNRQPHLTVDFFDGQVFYRVPDVAYLRFERVEKGLLSIGVLMLQPSHYPVESAIYQNRSYVRELENVSVPIYRQILIGLE